MAISPRKGVLHVDCCELVLQLYRLVGEHYVLDGEGRAGRPLRLTSPVVANLGPADLEL